MATAADLMYKAPVDVNIIILPGKLSAEGKPAQPTKPQHNDKDQPPIKNVYVENGRRKIVRQDTPASGSDSRVRSAGRSYDGADGKRHRKLSPEEQRRRMRLLSMVDIDDSRLYEVDLSLTDPKPEFPGPYDPERVRVLYRAACEMLNIVPSSLFQRSVSSGRVVAGYQGWGPLGTRAVAISLVIVGARRSLKHASEEEVGLQTALTVTELHIPGNRLGPEGMQCMCNLIQGNEVIKVLDVSENDLGRKGAKVLAQAIAENESIQEFIASGNKFDDPAGVCIGNAIKVNEQLRQLDLSRNMFSESGAVAIAKSLEENMNIVYLDLSYNHLRPKGIKGISKMLAKNSGLLNLNLSWNGIGRDGAKALGEGLNSNDTLSCLGANGCRLNLESLLGMLKKMPENMCLKALEIADNPLTNADMCLFIRTIQLIPDFPINLVDANSVMVSEDFLEIVSDIEKQRPGFVVVYRGLLSIKDMSKNMMQTLDLSGGDPLEALIVYCRCKNLRLVDLFSRFDLDKSGTMTRQELIHGVANAGIPLTIKQMDRLVAKLDMDGDGEIDFAELLEGYKRYMKSLHKKGIVARDKLKADGGVYRETDAPETAGKGPPPTAKATEEKRGSIPSEERREATQREKQLREGSLQGTNGPTDDLLGGADPSEEKTARDAPTGDERPGQEKPEDEPNKPEDTVD